MSQDSLEQAPAHIQERIEQAVGQLSQQLLQAGAQASIVLRNAALDVLGGQRSGRRYKVPGTNQYYTASAPGEPPAVRSGALRLGWQPTVQTEHSGTSFTVRPGINIQGPPAVYAPILDPALRGGSSGDGLNRPYVQRIRDQAREDIAKLLPQ